MNAKKRKKRLHSSGHNRKSCWSLKRRAIFKNPNAVLQRRLRSFHWSFLEIYAMKRASALSQRLWHFFTVKLLQGHKRSVSAYLVNQLVSPFKRQFTNWSNTLKQFFVKLAVNCFRVFDHFVGCGLKDWTFVMDCIELADFVNISKNIRSSQDSILTNSCAEVNFFRVSFIHFSDSLRFLKVAPRKLKTLF